MHDAQNALLIMYMYTPSGEFGIVYRALLTIQEKKEMTMIPIAVKTLKSLIKCYHVSISNSILST